MRPFRLHYQLVHEDENAVHTEYFRDMSLEHEFCVSETAMYSDGLLPSETVDVTTAFPLI